MYSCIGICITSGGMDGRCAGSYYLFSILFLFSPDWVLFGGLDSPLLLLFPISRVLRRYTGYLFLCFSGCGVNGLVYIPYCFEPELGFGIYRKCTMSMLLFSEYHMRHMDWDRVLWSPFIHTVFLHVQCQSWYYFPVLSKCIRDVAHVTTGL